MTNSAPHSDILNVEQDSQSPSSDRNMQEVHKTSKNLCNMVIIVEEAPFGSERLAAGHDANDL